MLGFYLRDLRLRLRYVLLCETILHKIQQLQYIISVYYTINVQSLVC